jgi:hypothetical protein
VLKGKFAVYIFHFPYSRVDMGRVKGSFRDIEVWP